MQLIIAVLLMAVAGFAQPKRIVSTAPSVTETLYALGVGDRVVGVSTYCHYPPEVNRKPRIGSYLHPNLEAIAALRPDLVVINRKAGGAKERLTSMGIKVAEVEDTGVPALWESISTIGAAVGLPDKARQLTATIRGQLDEVRNKSAKLPRRTVTFIVGRTPGVLEDLIAAGKGSYLGEILAIAGGDNIFANAPMMYPKVGLEEILSRNPAVIIDMGDMAQTVGVTEAHKQKIVKLWSQYAQLNAVREKRVYAVASDIFVVPGPRVAEAAREFFRMIHPEAK